VTHEAMLTHLTRNISVL